MASEKTASFILKLVDMVTGPLGKISNMAGSVIGKFDSVAGSLARAGRTALFLTSLNTAITGTADALNTAIAPGQKFEVQLKDMQAITGVTNDQLVSLGENARATALMFGGDAADQVEAYKVILSKLGPEIAKSPEALDQMGKSVQLMSKTMGGDAVGAVEALTTAMNQYSVDLSDPIEASKSMARMMDIISNGAQVGSAEVPQISESIKVAGLSAKNAGLSFEEMNAAIQIMGKGSVYGAEAGTALRNVLSLLGREDFIPKVAKEQMEALGVDIHKIADTTLPFGERLKELQKIQGDSALITKVFGMENKNAAMLLMGNIPLYEKWTEEVGKSGTTMEMATTIMGSHEEQMKRVMAQISDYGISVFNATKGALPFIQTLVMAIAFSSQLIPGLTFMGSGLLKVGAGFKAAALSGLGFIKTLILSGSSAMVTGASFMFTALVGLGSFIVSIGTATLAMFGLNVAMYANPIGLMIIGLLAVGAAVAAVIYWWDDLKVYMVNVALFLMKLNPFYWLIELIDFVFPGFKQALVDFFGEVWNFIKAFWDKVVGVWDNIKSFFGGSDLSATLNANVTGGTTITYDNGDPKDGKPKPNDVAGGLNTINTADRKTEVQGDSGKSRVVNVRIDKIETNVSVDTNNTFSIRQIGEIVTQQIVGAARDSEIMLSNG